MPEHKSLRERLAKLSGAGREPVFEASADSVLVEFGRLFADSQLVAFDASKHLRTDALSPIYDCETESQSSAEAAPERFVVYWAPVWQRDSPVTGFRTGRDSTLLGSTPTVAMPQDERTAALLLLVTSTFVHLSGRSEAGHMLIQGAAEADDGGYRYLTLDPTTLAVDQNVEPSAGLSSPTVRGGRPGP